MSETNAPPTMPADLAAKIAAMPFTATLTYKAADHKSGPDRWTCTLNREEFTYSKGTGLRSLSARLQTLKCPANPPRSVYDHSAWSESYIPMAPTVYELLASLVMDAGCYTDSTDLDDFAANFCDVRNDGIQAALDAYNACARTDRLLCRWFRPTELEALRDWVANL